VSQLESVEEKVRQGYYKNKLKYPNFDNVRKLLNNLGNLILLSEESGISIRFIMEKVSPALLEYDKKNQEYREYLEEDRRLSDLFRKDLIDENGTKDNPYEPEIFALAYEQGHSSGLGDVASIYSDLSYRFTYPPREELCLFR